MAMRAAIMLAQGSAQAAADLAQRHLRAVSASAMTERIGVLETLVRAALALEDHAAAASAVAELGTIAQTIATAGVRAAAAACRGLHAVSAGEPTTAIAALEDALELYEEAGMVPDVVATLVELARVHLAVGDLERAATRAQRANKEAEALGAGAAAGVAEVLDALRPERRGGPAELTQRESEVIRLVAAGASNQDIAARLFLSIRTVERHLSNIYLKIGAAGPSARTVAASYAHRHGHT
jgi:DNA-binding NarL/FixJ family response regulator